MQFFIQLLSDPLGFYRAHQLLLDEMLEACKDRGLLQARARQRTDSTHVLAATRDLNRRELVGETLRAALGTELDDLRMS